MSEMRNTPLLEAVCALVKQRGKLGYLIAFEAIEALLRQHRPEIMGPEEEELSESGQKLFNERLMAYAIEAFNPPSDWSKEAPLPNLNPAQEETKWE